MRCPQTLPLPLEHAASPAACSPFVRRTRGRATYQAPPAEAATLLRLLADDLDATAHPVHSIKVSNDANRITLQARWLWWADPAPVILPSMAPNLTHFPREQQIVASTAGDHNLPELLRTGAEWVEAVGCGQLDLRRDIDTGWWVLTIA